MVRAMPVVADNNKSLPSPAKKPKIDDNDDNNDDDDETNAAAAASVPTKQIRGRRSKKTPTVDGALSATTASHQNAGAPVYALPPPPPPPPPPPADNPYYKKFVEAYWQKYGGDACYSTGIPPPPPGMPFFPPPPAFTPLLFPPTATVTATTSPKHSSSSSRAAKKYHASSILLANLPPLTLSQEFPINTDRPSFFLGDPKRDPTSLSEKSCYIRTRLIEAFLTLPTDAIHTKELIHNTTTNNTNNTPPTPRLGLRCTYCATHPPKTRAERSTTYPSSLSRLYNAVADMQHRHLEKCPYIPSRVRERALSLNASLNRYRKGGNGSVVGSGVSPKVYWEECARSMGMEDVVVEGRGVGIRLGEGHGMVRKCWEVVERWFGEGKEGGGGEDVEEEGDKSGQEKEEEKRNEEEEWRKDENGEGEKEKEEENTKEAWMEDQCGDGEFLEEKNKEEESMKISGDGEVKEEEMEEDPDSAEVHDKSEEKKEEKIHEVHDQSEIKREPTIDEADEEVEEILAHL